MNESVSIDIIAADDHKLFLEGLKSLFEYIPNINLVAVCEDGNEVLNKIEQYKPDVALIDLSMPGANTEMIIASVDKNYPDTQLIALTMHIEPPRAEQLLKLGLCGYVLKEEAFDELNKAINTIKSGKQYISPVMLSAIQNYHKNFAQNQLLTNREIAVLKQVAQGRSNKEIARTLAISERTVRFHISNCCIKLDAKGRSNAVVNAMKLKFL